MLSRIVSDICTTKNERKSHSRLKKVHNKVLDQTQIIVKISALVIKHLQKKKIMPSLTKKLENSIVFSFNHNKRQMLRLEADINQTFYT